jgi:hypothetical protein
MARSAHQLIKLLARSSGPLSSRKAFGRLRHTGILDVVIDGETRFPRRQARCVRNDQADDPTLLQRLELARQFGLAAHKRIETSTMDGSIGWLLATIESCLDGAR